MLKKFLIFPLIGGLMSFGAFASADCLENGLSSESDLTDITSNASQLGDNMLNYPKNGTLNGYVCVIQDVEGNTVSDNSNITYYNNNKIVCSNSSVNSFMYEFSSSISSYSIYTSSSPITYVSSCSSSDSSDSSTVFPSVPSSFTSGITSLVSNFGSTIVNWLPSVILVAMGIFAIFALFRVVRNYARSSFRG